MALSMFTEFIKTKDRFESMSKKRKSTEDNPLPAMIILERKETNENKHAMVGDPLDIITLFEWGISQISEGYGCEFSEMLELIQKFHDAGVSKIMFTDIKKEI